MTLLSQCFSRSPYLFGLRRMSTEMGAENIAKMILIASSLRCDSPDVYKNIREICKTFQRKGTVGSSIQLTKAEEVANEIIMKAKIDEYNSGKLDPSKFAPGQHIFQVLPMIRDSKVFQLLKHMPKGGALKTHDTSLCSTEFLIDLTYKENLWVCTTENGKSVRGFRFSEEKPKLKLEAKCEWEPMEKFRECNGDEKVCKYLYKRFSMFPLSSFSSSAKAWKHFLGIFDLLDGLIRYAPVWGEYFYNALEEYQEDNVQYLEVRTLMPQLYELDGSLLPVKQTMKTYEQTLKCFMKENPNFIGAKFIYAPLRNVEPKVVAEYVKTCTELNKEFPHLLIGFDLVGNENMGGPLINFVDELLKMPEEVKFYFHAGQTSWSGTRVDENLIDAVLLGTKRIGHGFAVTKHPIIMALAKYMGIAIEVCPIGNQVLQLGDDIRNHPASMLIAKKVPIVISTDNPSFWHATPLSHDMYMVFLGIAPMNADLKFLKRVVKNSIRYSALRDEEKARAMHIWKTKWDKWIQKLIKNENEDDTSCENVD